MDRDAGPRAPVLDRYWDAVLHQDADHVSSIDVEPDDAAIIERVRSLEPATPLFLDPKRAWHEVLRRSVSQDVGAAHTGVPRNSTAPLTFSPQGSNGHVPAERIVPGGALPQVQHPSRLSRRVLPHLATAVLVLLIVVIGYLTLTPR